ncbi:MAG: lipase family protein [Bryobacteraceae bacterium]
MSNSIALPYGQAILSAPPAGTCREDRIAPSYAALRPMLAHPISDEFPVYKELVPRLVKMDANDHPNQLLAHVLSVCCGYSYSDAATVAMIMARLGLAENRCRMISQTVDAMSIRSTAFLVQSKDGRVVILCYRGTEPLNPLTYLTVSDVYPEKLRFSVGAEGPFDVHAGFYRNVRATRYEVIQALERALNGKSVLEEEEKAGTARTGEEHGRERLEALYITGHSLGGAMAALMTIMLLNEEADGSPRGRLFQKLRGLYTFGQPMIGNPKFAAACDRALKGKPMMRYIYQKDAVSTLPPKTTGDFAHFGPEMVYQQNEWHLREEKTGQARSVLALPEAFIAYVARQLSVSRLIPFNYSIPDHVPQSYISALTPGTVTSEFGD